jgi:DNA-binding transcriptional MerR regulator
MYTVKQLSDLAGVSVRTLHYYDEIGLLHPAEVGGNRYRYYDDAALLRLQQILFYREIGLELTQIREALDTPGFDLVAALRSHRVALEDKISRLRNLINTVDQTLKHITGEATMSKKAMFEAFSDEKQKHYEQVARDEYGPELVDESVRRWHGYTKAQQSEILKEAGQVYTELVEALEAKVPTHSAEVQAMLSRWHQNLRYFYEPAPEILRGLGEMYNAHPEFNATFTAMHPDLPAYLQAAIAEYVDALEGI